MKGAGVAGWVISNRKPALVADVASDPRFAFHGRKDIDFTPRDMVCVPLIAGDRVLGVLTLLNKRNGTFTEEDARLMESVGSVAASAIQSAWLFEKVGEGRARLQSLSRQLVRIQESERRAVSRELHDEAGQSLTSLKVDLHLLEAKAGDPDAVRAGISDLGGAGFLKRVDEMGIKTLLVYPEIPPTYWSLKYALPFIGKRAVFPPLGLMTVGAMLPDDFDVTLVDMNVEPLRESAVAGADLVLTSSMIVQKDSLEKVIGLCKKHGKTVVAGGPYPTSMNAQIPGIDHFVLNEAEVTLPAFLEDFRNGKAKLLYTDAAKPDMALTPAPRFDLIRKSRYSTMALQYSRGCPHNCEFCDIIEMFGRVPRTKTPSQFLQEMDLLYEEGWRGSLFVVDDNFIGNRREVKKLLPEIASWQQERNYPFNLFTEATLVLAEDKQLMDQMVLAGFNMVFVGIETPDRETLAVTGKTQNLRGDMLQSVRAIQAKGMEVSAGFILGFDGDKDDIFDRQIRFIQDAAIPTAMVGILTALPNTQLYRRLDAEGRITQDSVGGNTHDLRLNFVPTMDLEKLFAGYKRVIATIYKPDRYFDRCLKLLKNTRKHTTSASAGREGVPRPAEAWNTQMVRGVLTSAPRGG